MLSPSFPMNDHRHDDVQVVQLEELEEVELEEVEHEQDSDTRDARPSAVVVATFQSRREPSPYKPVKCSAGTWCARRRLCRGLPAADLGCT